MKIYVWERLTDLTDAWHSEGGLMICTNRDYAGVFHEECLRDGSGLQTNELPEPDFAYDVAGNPAEKVIVFPDMGCC